MNLKLRCVLALLLCLAMPFSSVALADEPEEPVAVEAVESTVKESSEAQLGEAYEAPVDVTAVTEEPEPVAEEPETATEEPEAQEPESLAEEPEPVAKEIPAVEEPDIAAVESEDIILTVEDEYSGEIITEAQAVDLFEEEASDAAESDVVFESASTLAETAGDITINADNFPDANFRSFVEKYDKDSSGSLSETERSSVEDIDILNSVTSLKGIEHFANLKHLDCGSSALTELDLSGNTKLEYLLCSGNSLTSLDLSKNTALKTLICSNNKLTSLVVTNCTALTQLCCEGNNLTTLDISTCTSLISVVDVNVKTPVYVNGTVMYGEDTGSYLKCDSSVAIVGGNPADSQSTVVTVTIKKRNTKGTAYVGKTYQIDLGTYTGKSYKSSNKKVVTVSSTGLITPKKIGRARITFKVGTKKCTITLKVKDPTIPKSVTLDQTGTVSAKKGETVTLTATLPEGTTSSIKWTTSDKKVATVSKGVVTFKKKGKVTITATATRGKKKAKVKFKVTN